MICSLCFWCHKITIRSGKQKQIKETIWKCSRNMKLVFYQRTNRHKIKEENVCIETCDKFSDPIHNEKQGVKLPWPYFHILPDDWLHRSDWMGRVR